jgi:excinuclease ABC subunit A
VPVKKQSLQAILQIVTEKARGGMIHIMAPLIKARKGFHTEVAENARKHGIETLLVDGEFKDTLGFKKLARFKEHTIDAVIARTGRNETAGTLRPHIEKALRMGHGTLKLRLADRSLLVLNTEMSCPNCGLSFEELDPRLFSFNSPHGWCRECRGFGVTGAAAPQPREHDQSALEAEMDEERRFASEDEETPRHTCAGCGGSRVNELARAVTSPRSPPSARRRRWQS